MNGNAPYKKRDARHQIFVLNAAAAGCYSPKIMLIMMCVGIEKIKSQKGYTKSFCAAGLCTGENNLHFDY